MEKRTIGTFIAALRKASGMTQQELADRLNISNKAVSRWERDECAPDITLIPAIAEIFGVTCDELLKGERIFTEHNQEKGEPKVEKQLKALINRSISSFKTLLWISIALSVVGLVCMFGISYGFYRPIIGFAIMILFEAAAFVLAIIGVNKMKEVKKENELFDNADSSLISNYNTLKGIGMSLGISTNLEAVTAQYVDVRLERKKSVLDVYHKALHPPKGDGEKKQGDGGKEEKTKKKSSDIEL